MFWEVGTTELMYTKFAGGERRYAIQPFCEKIINVKELYYGLYKRRDGRACVALIYVKITVVNTALTLSSLLNRPKPAGWKHATIPEPAKTGQKKRHCLRLLSPPLIKNICSPNIFLLLLRY